MGFATLLLLLGNSASCLYHMLLGSASDLNGSAADGGVCGLRLIQPALCCCYTAIVHRVAKVVEPKRQKLREAEAELEKANSQLREKQNALAAVVARVNDLKKQLSDAHSEQCKLNDQVRTPVAAAGSSIVL